MSETANTQDFNIEALPVVITYVGETTRDDWKCDHWSVRISGKDGHWTTDYYTGLGLRGPRTERVWDNGPEPSRGTLLWERLEASRKPVKPKIADVLFSLFMDADAADYNFDEWCESGGYSNDSIKALNLYKQCLDTATRLRKYFTKEQRQAIKALIAEM